MLAAAGAVAAVAIAGALVLRRGREQPPVVLARIGRLAIIERTTSARPPRRPLDVCAAVCSGRDRRAGYARSSAPNCSASAATMRSRSCVACSSESVPSLDWYATENATDLRPSPTCSPR